MGPSGAGKDSVLDRARASLTADAPVIFAHRYITRDASAGGENHVALTSREFALRLQHGLFAFHWQAHGNHYGIGREIHDWRHAGLTVVVSGSREHFGKAEGIDAGTHPVLITASPQQLAERLAGRGREDSGKAAARLDRGARYQVTDRRVVTIINDSALDTAAEEFVSLLATLRCSPAGRRQA